MASNPVVATNSVEIQDFQFKLFSRLRILPEDASVSLHDSLSLVAAASKYGLLFIGCPDGFQVLQIGEIIKLQDCVSSARKELTEFPHRDVVLPSQPTNLAVNCDCSLLSVVLQIDGCQIIRIYSVESFFSQSIRLVQEVRASSTPGVFVSGLCWNPGIANLLALCFTDGSVCVYEFKDSNFSINSLPPKARATCLCWSPKGKQLVVGSFDGTLTQYKPELKAVKQFPPPNLNQHEVSVVNVHWISSYQFICVYKEALIVVNAPKTGPASYVYYEDMCYSTGNLRAPQYYIEHLQQWNVMIVASGNSIEVGVLGADAAAEGSWQQWLQDCDSRAELPLTKKRQETFPVGLAVDTSTQYNLTWGSEGNLQLPTMPLLCLLSNEGLLCLYFVVNILPNADQLCSPPVMPSDLSGLASFVCKAPAVKQVKVPDVGCDAEGTVSQVHNAPTDVTSFYSPIISPSVAAVSAGGMPSLSAAPFAGTPLANTLPSWMTPPQQESLAEKNNEKVGSVVGIENISPPNGSVAKSVTPGIGGAGLGTGLFTGSGFSLQKGSPSIQHQQQSVQEPQKSSFTFSPVTPEVGGDSVAPPPNLFVGGKSFGAPITGLLGSATENSPRSVNNDNAQTTITARPIGSIMTPANQKGTVVGASNVPATQSFQQSNTMVIKPQMQQISAPDSGSHESSETGTTHDDVIDVSEEVVNAAMIEEIKHFDSELKDLFTSIKNVNIEVGNDDAKNKVNSSVESLTGFVKELKDTTNTLKSEIDALKHLTLETFCWVEDGKARYQQHMDPGYEKLVFLQELDPVSKKKMDSIKNSIFYIENQLKQGSKVLDDTFLDYQQNNNLIVNNDIKLPPREELYQTLVVQNNLVNKHRSVLEGIKRQIEQYRMEIGQPNKKFVKSNESTELSALAENLLQIRLNESIKNIENVDPTGTKKETVNNVVGLKEELKNLEEKLLGVRQKYDDAVTSVPKVRLRLLLDEQQLNEPNSFTVKSLLLPADQKSACRELLNKYKIPSIKEDVEKASNSNKECFADDPLRSCNSNNNVVEKVQPRNQQQISTLFVNKQAQSALPISSGLSSATTVVSIKQPQTPAANKNLSNNSGDNDTGQVILIPSEMVAAISFKQAFATSDVENQSPIMPVKNAVASIKPDSTSGNVDKSEIFKTSSSPSMFFNPSASISSPMVSTGLGTTVNQNECKPAGTIGTTASNLFSGFGSPSSVVSSSTSSTTVSSSQSKPAVFDGAGVDLIKSPLSAYSSNQSQLDNKTAQNVTDDSTTTKDINVAVSKSGSLFGGTSYTFGSGKNLFGGNSSPVGQTSFVFGSNLQSSTPQKQSNTLNASPIASNFQFSLSSLTVTTEQPNVTATVAATLDSSKPTIAVKPSSTSTWSTSSTTASVFSSLTMTPSATTNKSSSGSVVVTTSSATKDSDVAVNKASVEPPVATTAADLTTPVKNNNGGIPETVVVLSTPGEVVSASTITSSPLPGGSPSNITSSALTEISSTGTKVENKLEVKPVSSIVSSMTVSTSSSGVMSSLSLDKLSVSTAPTKSAYEFSFAQIMTPTSPEQESGSKMPLNFGQTGGTSLFGGASSAITNTTQPVGTSIFGQPNQQASASTPSTPFSFTLPAESSQPVSSPSSASSFFGGKPIFGSPVTTSTTSTFFGTPASTNSNIFGQNISTGSTSFGQMTASPMASTFNNSPFSGKPLFGQSTGSVFGQNTSGNTFGNTPGSVFGGTSLFGGTPTTPDNSGQTAAGLFQSTPGSSPGNLFAAASGQSVNQSGFGSPSFQNKPAFGAAPSFGGTATFGGSPTFGIGGSPGKVFGNSPPPASGFGSGTQMSTTFENLANQNTMSFGNLAQGQQTTFGNNTGSLFGTPNQQATPAPAFPTTTFGGNSFSNWR